MSVDNFARRDLSRSNLPHNFSDASKINGIHFVSSESKRHAAAGQTHLTVLHEAHRIVYSQKKTLHSLSFTEAEPVIYMRIVFRSILPVLACLLLLCAIVLPSRSAQKTSNPA